MNQQDEPGVPDLLRHEVPAQHPTINDEIEGAINTLRKLKRIAGTLAPGQSYAAPHGDLPANLATDATVAPDSSADEADAEFTLAEQASAPPAREVPVLAAGESFGRYQITRLLGRGAMGAVYLAYDSNLQRFVALKTPFLSNKPHIIKRFYREARAAAQIRSPYICPIYDVDQISGIHYLSMAFIDGQPLSRVIVGEHGKDHPQIAGIVKKIARGIQKAHDKGIIHRDIKPDNIMLDADGEPIVMDFGLARRVDDEIKVTQAGRILGTPAYMSPEQAEGDAKKIGPPTDIYSLGVVLFEMLTGRLPFEGPFLTILRKIGSDAPPLPSSLCAKLEANSPLEQICLKMMAKKPADRYARMADVADALDRLTAPQEPAPAPPSLLARAWAWLTKRKSTPAPAPTPEAPKLPDMSQTSDSNVPQRTFADSRASAPGSAELQTIDSHPPADAASVPDFTIADPGQSAAGISHHLMSDSQTVDLAPVQNSGTEGAATMD
jgi:serine/threonine protein kinase